MVTMSGLPGMRPVALITQAEEAESLKVKAQSRQREYERVVQELSLARSREQEHWAKAKEVR